MHRAFAAVIEQTLNIRLRMHPEAADNLSELRHKTIGLKITTLDLPIFFVPDTTVKPAQMRVRTALTAEPTTWIRGSVVNLVKAARTGRYAGVHLEISGDIGAGEIFQHVLRQAQLDWEELLAQVIGDISAYQVGENVRATGRWVRHVAGSVAFSAGEYLCEETDLAVNAWHIRRFIDQVDQLRDDVSRLSMRLSQLQEHHRW